MCCLPVAWQQLWFRFWQRLWWKDQPRVGADQRQSAVSDSSLQNPTIGDQFNGENHPEVDPILVLQDKFFTARREWPKDGNQYFIPADELRSLVTVDSILNQLKRSKTNLPDDQLQRMAEDACESAYKLFAILVCENMAGSFYSFLREGLSDKDLPFSRSLDTNGKLNQLHSRLTPDKAIQSMKGWGLYQISNFSRDQWQMLAPIFRKSDLVEHYELLDNHILPFIEDYERDMTNSGFSSVWRVVIHHAHQFIYQIKNNENTNPVLAIKQLYSIEPKAFEVEVEMLKAFSNRPDRHLIKLLATYRWKGRYHLIFPYAKSNLREFWQNKPNFEFSQTSVLWFLNQCKGIASGLLSIHEYQNSDQKQAGFGNELHPDLNHGSSGERRYGRHGDIKPENILWSDEDCADAHSNPDGLGFLIIADFGLMEFHGEHTRSKVRPEGKSGSPTYEPPEIGLLRPISRAYDIWSLGCVYLEFITWLVKGWSVLFTFPDVRALTKANGVNDDTFFTITYDNKSPNPQAIVRESVTKWIENLYLDDHSSLFIHEFLDLISKDMLVVDVDCRINCGMLNARLSEMIHKAEMDPEYLTHPAPRIARARPSSSAGVPPSESQLASNLDATADSISIRISPVITFEPAPP